MKATFLLIAAVLLFGASVWAQEPAQAEPPINETATSSATPVVRFVFDWKAQDPPRYSIAVDSTGRATYRSEPSPDSNGGSAPEPYQVEWTVGEAIRTKIFDDARKLNYFEGNFEAKAKVAQTGVKTLTYRDPSHDHSTSYNYSENPSIREVTQIFQSMATAAEAGRKLTYDLRFDKLGIDRDLKSLQESQKAGFAVELGSALPILQRIADDPAVLRISQQRARQILAAGGFSASGTANASRP
jgi:hypothetical protein